MMVKAFFLLCSDDTVVPSAEIQFSRYLCCTCEPVTFYLYFSHAYELSNQAGSQPLQKTCGLN